MPGDRLPSTGVALAEAWVAALERRGDDRREAARDVEASLDKVERPAGRSPDGARDALMAKGDPVCSVCRKNTVPKHELPIPPNKPVCDACARAGQTTVSR